MLLAAATKLTGLYIIDKFPFASDANATDVGNLTVGRYGRQVKVHKLMVIILAGGMARTGGAPSINFLSRLTLTQQM